MKSLLPNPKPAILFIVLLLCFQTVAEAKIYYVSKTAIGNENGGSWSDAFTSLQDAIDAAAPGDTICVAAGEYLPTHLNGTDSVRSVTFYINKSILLFGGFEGISGTEGNFTVRNPKLHSTLLSGDTGSPGIDSDNVFHVVYIDHVSDSMRLDGFTIDFGNSTGAGGFDAYGAGIYNDAIGGRSNPSIINCTICENVAGENGGGLMNNAGEGGIAQPLIMNCKFNENKAGGGGAISNYTENGGVASPLLINCNLVGNEAPTAQGGAISCIAHSGVSSPTLINCTVTGNHSPTSAAFTAFVTGTGNSSPEFYNCAFSGNTGGSIRVVDLGAQASLIIIRNSILWGNTGGAGLSMNGANADVTFSIIQFGFSGEGNLSEDPLFVLQPPVDSSNTDGDLHLQENSPAIDAGNNSDVPADIATDLDNQPRFVDPGNGETGIVDIGPYEIQSITTGIKSFLSEKDWNVYPNPVNSQLVITLPKIEKEGEFLIVNSNGGIVYKQRLIANQIQHSVDVSRMPSGIYFVHLVLDGLYGVEKILVP